MQASIPRLIFSLLLLGFLLVSCVSSPATSAVLVDSIPPTTPILIQLPIKTPTFTASVFELLPSSTPIPSPTKFQMDIPYHGGIGPFEFPPDVDPLTGQQVLNPALLVRRPMIIKITNFPRSVRPQWGLTVADHIYEYYLENELTRFIGVFYGKDAERIGAIRSARPFDEHIVRAYKGIFVFAYGDDRLMDFWEDSDITPYMVIERPDNCPPMCRIGSEDSYNTLFTNTEQLTEYVSSRKFSHGRQDLRGLWFDPDRYSLIGGTPATRLEIRYSPSSYNYWEYDPVTLRYYRWQDAIRRPEGEEIYEPLFDSLTAQQVFADNLIVLLVPTTYFYKSNSTKVYDIQMIDQGKGFALREGSIYEIIWNRPLKDSLVTITYPDGSPYALRPGNLFFQVLSEVSTYQISEKTWKFKFEIPDLLPTPTKTPKK
jgi:hypothetical protein